MRKYECNCKISPRFKILAYIYNIGADSRKEAPGSSQENATNKTADVVWDVSVHEEEAPRPFWDAVDIDEEGEEDKAYEVDNTPCHTIVIKGICIAFS